MHSRKISRELNLNNTIFEEDEEELGDGLPDQNSTG
jgi:hypothetical protein